MSVVDIVVSKTVATLKTLEQHGVKYHVVFGNSEYTSVASVKGKGKGKPRGSRYTSLHPWGAITAYVKPYIDPMQVGDVVTIPRGQFKKTSIASTTAAYAHRTWGSEAHTCHAIEDGVEIMRLK